MLWSSSAQTGPYIQARLGFPYGGAYPNSQNFSNLTASSYQPTTQTSSRLSRHGRVPYVYVRKVRAFCFPFEYPVCSTFWLHYPLNIIRVILWLLILFRILLSSFVACNLFYEFPLWIKRKFSVSSPRDCHDACTSVLCLYLRICTVHKSLDKTRYHCLAGTSKHQNWPS